jgi:hypothetical protein|tara:strand:- start:2878 stop:3027 length:150 start_codon:yes stop_codon:yes gene_type:complete
MVLMPVVVVFIVLGVGRVVILVFVVVVIRVIVLRGIVVVRVLGTLVRLA